MIAPSRAARPPTVEASVEAYRRKGWHPIPLRAKGKRPTASKGWQTAEYKPSLAEFKDRNVGLRCGPGAVGGGLVCVDLDCQEAIELAPHVLPSTNMVHGRPSSRSSHYWYCCDDAGKGHAYKAKDNLLDLLGAKKQCVVPPSVHGSGERLVWELAGDPARIAYAELERLARLLAAAAYCMRGLGWAAERALAWIRAPEAADIPPADRAKVMGWAGKPQRPPSKRKPPQRPTAGLEPIAKVQAALRALSPDCARDEWLRVGMALHDWDAQAGLGVWDRWSAGAAGEGTYPGSAELEAQWRSFKRGGGIGINTLFFMAQERGWDPRAWAPPMVELRDRSGEPDKPKPKKPDPTALATDPCFDPKPVDFLLDPYLPLGMLTMLDGESHEGKTVIMAQALAAVTSGGPIFGQPRPEGTKPGLAFYAGAESSISQEFMPRFLAAGGVRERLRLLQPDVELSVAAVVEGIKQHKPMLTGIDHLTDLLAGKNMNQATETAPSLLKIARALEETGGASLLANHLSQSNDVSSANRSAGSFAIKAKPRSCMRVGTILKTGLRALVLWKSPTERVRPHEKGLRFDTRQASLMHKGRDLKPIVVDWSGETDVNWQHFNKELGERRPGRKKNENKRCKSFLAEELATGPKTKKELLSDWSDIGGSKGSFNRSGREMEKAGKLTKLEGGKRWAFDGHTKQPQTELFEGDSGSPTAERTENEPDSSQNVRDANRNQRFKRETDQAAVNQPASGCRPTPRANQGQAEKGAENSSAPDQARGRRGAREGEPIQPGRPGEHRRSPPGGDRGRAGGKDRGSHGAAQAESSDQGGAGNGQGARSSRERIRSYI